TDGANNPRRAGRTPETKNAPTSGVFRIWRRERVQENPLGFDNFVWNEFGRPQGRPRSAKRGGVSPMDGANNPSHATVAHGGLGRNLLIILQQRRAIFRVPAKKD
ncbi:MAG: hypothetical protein ABIR10_05080, partial [Dokdonella sp.]